MKTGLNEKLIFLIVMFLFNFTVAQTSSAIITRNEIMSVAESYKDHLWTASKGNICSNKVVGKVRIDTPDKNCKSACYNLGWWDSKGKTNQSVPYKWGGFNTLSSFDDGIRAGACGGDVGRIVLGRSRAASAAILAADRADGDRGLELGAAHRSASSSADTRASSASSLCQSERGA